MVYVGLLLIVIAAGLGLFAHLIIAPALLLTFGIILVSVGSVFSSLTTIIY